MSLPNMSSEKRSTSSSSEKPEANIAHVRPMVIKQPVTMATQWSSGYQSQPQTSSAALSSSLFGGLPLSPYPFMYE